MVAARWPRHIKDNHLHLGVLRCHVPNCGWNTHFARTDALFDHWSNVHDYYRPGDPKARSTDESHLSRKVREVLEQILTDDCSELEARKARVQFLEAEITTYQPRYVPSHGLTTTPGEPLHVLLNKTKSQLVDEVIRARTQLSQDWDGTLAALTLCVISNKAQAQQQADNQG